MVAGACLHWVLPERLSLGPSWLLLAVIFVLLIPIGVSHYRGLLDLARILTFVATGALTLALLSSLILLVKGLPQHRDTPGILLRSAAVLWLTNVLVFALWYWKLDAGGPNERDRARGRLQSSFYFPQMLRQDKSDRSWSPEFLDYLFLAFNTSTAFSPTDTAILARWAKLCMMLQSLISLSIVALLAARAINVL